MEVTWKKLAQVSYNTAEVQGAHATLKAKNPSTDESFEEKKQIDNDGTLELTFPLDYTGTCEWSVRGSSAGEDSGSFEIE